MTVNKKIENALSDLVDGNIWPLLCPLETPPEKWITYTPEFDAPEEFGDDQDLEWVHHMQIHYFQKGQVNYYSVRQQMRSALQEAGFTLEQFNVTYETDGGYTHLTYTGTIVEDHDDGEDKS